MSSEPTDKRGKKRCEDCGEWFAVAKFPQYHQDGRRLRWPICVFCKQRKPKPEAATPKPDSPNYTDRHRGYVRKSKYGITSDAYALMHKRQGGLCFICRRPNISRRGGTSKPLFVDHDHQTEKVRALLCSHCNTMLGNAADDPATLRAAANYIELFRRVHDAQDRAAEAEGS